EVESFCKYMESTSLNKKISSVEVQSKTVLTKNLSPGLLQAKLKSCRFLSVKGYGKYLFAESNKGDFLVMHFGMTGYLNYYKDFDEATRFIRMQINFENGYHLAYDDGRKLGRIYLADDFIQFIKKKRLGVDPIREKINYSRFKEILIGKKGSVKTLLMNQAVLAGIGNIYSDEILFQSNIHPNSLINKIKEKDLKEIFKKMKEILNKAIKVNSDWEKISDKFLIHYRRPGKDCPVCSGKIKRSTIGGRSSYYCNKHQRIIN
ncbi:MAG TPA: DNA-formamidopyrimidine glycosylase family protein, partial [Ignavibacteriaceae bacterium]|nr:DNA-formamidopyrimidine glycosylase family protein [Ignavibacteriaceae bacterium]